jgi:hypothetical protein
MAKKMMSETERADYRDWRNACVRYAKTLDADEHDPRDATCLVVDARGGLYLFRFSPYRRGEDTSELAGFLDSISGNRAGSVAKPAC